MNSAATPQDIVIVGRSSSHFTRVARIFASELRVPFQFQIVSDLSSHECQAFAGNPALQIPTLLASGAAHFGTLNICRELHRVCPDALPVMWPEHLARPTHRNALELTLQAMATQVSLIMSQRGGVEPSSTYPLKLQARLAHSLAWLEQHFALEPEMFDGPPLHFSAVCLFCLVSHLRFRETFAPTLHPALVSFAQRFGARSSASETPFRFD